jgi:SAM-dependent methyltransferase
VGWDRFAGGDQRYLRDVQYADQARLTARAMLHIRYTTAEVGWFRWVARQVTWPPTAEVLEVGCGPGWLWEGAADALPAGLRLTLTDLSPGMVATAAQRVGALDRFTVVDAREADAQRLPFSSRSFDVVIANHMLYHLPDPGRGVAELARVCRRGGVVVAATNGPAHLRELWEIQATVLGCPPGSATVDVFGTGSGEPMLRHHFDEVEWRLYEDELHCTRADDVVAFMTSNPPGEDATPEQRHHLLALVEDRLERGDGVLRVSKETGVFLARRPKP